MTALVAAVGVVDAGPLPQAPEPVPWHRYLTPEATRFLAAGAVAARTAGVAALPADRVAVVCATHRSGLAEYVQTYRSGRDRKDRARNPIRGPQSSSNGPASHLSLHFGLRGPVLTLAAATGGGLAALDRAQSLLTAGRAGLVLAGGVDRPDPEAAAAALGEPDGGRDPVAAVLALTSMASAGRPALAELASVVTAPGGPVDHAARAALAAAGLAATEVEPPRSPATGCGAAGGLLEVALAVARVRRSARPVLCLAADPGGAVAAVVVRAAGGAS